MEKNPIVVHPTISSEAQTSPFEEAPYRTNRVGGIYLEQNHHLEDLTQEVSPLISLSPLIQLVEVEILQSKDYQNIHPLILMHIFQFLSTRIFGNTCVSNGKGQPIGFYAYALDWAQHRDFLQNF